MAKNNDLNRDMRQEDQSSDMQDKASHLRDSSNTNSTKDLNTTDMDFDMNDIEER